MAHSISFASDHILGKGRYAVVFKGFFKESRQVAVKRINLDNVSQSRREVDALEKLKHENVIRLLGHEDSDHYRLFALELCAATLDDYVKGKYVGQMPSQWDGLVDMAKGLEHVHSQQLVHRDIKPENILISLPSLDGTVRLKLSDFGLCKSTNGRESFSVSSAKGTPLYLAPEVLKILDEEIKEPRITLASDIFALGCTFFFYLTKGKNPFGIFSHVTKNVALGNATEMNLLSDHDTYPLIKRMIDSNPYARPKIAAVVKFLESKGTSSLKFIMHDFSFEMFSRHCQFHPVKLKLACALDFGRVCVLSCPDPSTQLSQWQKKYLESTNKSDVWKIGWNKEGTRIAAGCHNGTVVVWTEDYEKLFEENEHTGTVNSLQWNPNYSTYFATGDSNGISIVWDSDAKRAIDRFNFHSGSINDIRWIAKDEFASCSTDGAVYICKLGMETFYRQLQNNKSITSLQWSQFDSRLAFASLDGHVKIWKATDGESPTLLEKSDSEQFCLSWYQNETKSLLATGSRSSVYVWNLPIPYDGQSELIDQLTPESSQNGDIVSVLFSPNGKYLASFNKSCHVHIWWTEGWRLLSFFNIVAYPSSDALSWDMSSQKLAVATSLSTMVVMTADYESSDSLTCEKS